VALRGGVGRLEDDGTVAVLDVAYGGLGEFLAEGEPLAWLARAAVRSRLAYGEGLASPVRPGSAVWGVGLNYRSKQVATRRRVAEQPVLFLKAPGALTGGAIALPSQAPGCVDYEGEIAVVVGRHLHDAAPDVAVRAVIGVVAANDVTARDVMRTTGNPSLAKSFPGFGQFGAVVADPESIGGFAGIEVRTTVNGQLRQHDHGDGMILPVGELLALISRYTLLRPGDIVLTGTPAGTGDELGRYLAPGDVVEVGLGDLPPLCSRVVSSSLSDGQRQPLTAGGKK
jgi:2-keto-4-pentenoate hydratase/2-oxohepta-3-ene-1,7-dioic acid hydratase in catechol pathway